MAHRSKRFHTYFLLKTLFNCQTRRYRTTIAYTSSYHTIQHRLLSNYQWYNMRRRLYRTTIAYIQYINWPIKIKFKEKRKLRKNGDTISVFSSTFNRWSANTANQSSLISLYDFSSKNKSATLPFFYFSKFRRHSVSCHGQNVKSHPIRLKFCQ